MRPKRGATEVDSKQQSPLSSKMAEMENKLKEGLEGLRNEYLNQKTEVGNVQKPSNFESDLKAFETQMSEEIKAMKAEIEQLQDDLGKNKDDMEKIRKESNNKKLIFRGIQETKQDCLLNSLCDVIANKIGIDISKQEISNFYRLNKKNGLNINTENNKHTVRPVVVEFTTQWKRDEIFYAKKALKNSSIMICEVLTSANYDLFLKTREIFKNNAWTTRGNIYVLNNNKKNPS